MYKRKAAAGKLHAIEFTGMNTSCEAALVCYGPGSKIGGNRSAPRGSLADLGRSAVERIWNKRYPPGRRFQTRASRVAQLSVSMSSHRRTACGRPDAARSFTKTAARPPGCGRSPTMARKPDVPPSWPR